MKTLKEYIHYILEASDEVRSDADKDKDDENASSNDTNSNDGDDSKDGSDGEKDEKDEEKKKTTRRGDIKFTIWEAPDKKVKWLDDNEKYQKIEYKLQDKEKELEIDFLLGYQEDSWKLWIGKIGACSYDDDPYCSFDTDKFGEAIVKALDKVEEFLDKVEEDPDNYVQFYVNN